MPIHPTLNRSMASHPARRRPRLIVEAARMQARGLLRRGLAQPAGTPLGTLMEAEEACEALRRDASPTYRPARHVGLLAALLAAETARIVAAHDRESALLASVL
ncbi:MAG: DUF6477 family protein [Pseudomonadota bacterium]